MIWRVQRGQILNISIPRTNPWCGVSSVTVWWWILTEQRKIEKCNLTTMWHDGQHLEMQINNTHTKTPMCEGQERLKNTHNKRLKITLTLKKEVYIYLSKNGPSLNIPYRTNCEIQYFLGHWECITLRGMVWAVNLLGLRDASWPPPELMCECERMKAHCINYAVGILYKCINTFYIWSWR